MDQNSFGTKKAMNKKKKSVFLKYLKETLIKVGNFQSRVFLFLFYFTVFVPFALYYRLFSRGIICKNPDALSWMLRQTKEASEESLKQQY